MDKSDGDKNVAEDASQLIRNRSFKSKQLVRSQAIRESASPPRSASPLASPPPPPPPPGDAPDTLNYSDRRKPVSIQITGGGCESEYWCRTRLRRGASDTRLLSNNPRVACVCGACAQCPHCRGKKRRHKCPTKQDSGIVCSDDCQDCSDSENNGSNDSKKSISLDAEEYCKCPDRRDRERPRAALARADSDDKQEPTGPELVSFIKETLNKNGRDRVTLLRIEKELHSFVNDTGRCIVKFPVMTSYGRMLVHRCAALFQLSHHLDHNNKNAVIVSKSGTSGGRVPCTAFRAWCQAAFPPSPRHDTLAKSILKRDSNSLDEPAGGALNMNRSKSLEQREKEYERVRRRIFSSDNCTQDESQWPWGSAGPVRLLAPDPARNKLLKVQSLEGPAAEGAARRGVGKSHSFGGYGEQPRPISTHGDLASSSWRLSPSSSGYKTLSLRSTDSVTPSPTGGGSPEPGGCVVWAVTDLAAVPRGALVIHPQTGRPLTNPDGSVYHFDPANPPALYDPPYADEQNKIDPNNEKQRGRLEKQHSFIDADIECHQTDECRGKCYCECRRLEQQKPQEKEPQQKPSTPIKTRYETPIEPEPTNHMPPPEPPTNPTVETPQPITERVDPNAANRRQYENQVPVKSFELTNQRVEKNLNNEHNNMIYGQQYVQAYNEEVSSPLQMQHYMQDMTNMNQMQAKVAPMQIQDPNIRPLSLTNVMYPPMLQQPYPYLHNQIRTDQLQQLYQPMLQQQLEEQHKQMSVQQPHAHTDSQFRIDPSYPYPPLEYAACACADTTQQQRSYSVGYNGVEMSPVAGTVVPGSYPLHNVLVPAVPQYPVQYPEAVQWPAGPKMFDVCPVNVMYPPHYTHYNVVYPQMVPPYPLAARRRPARAPPAPRTPLLEEKPTEQDINHKITAIKEQMARLDMRGRERNGEWRNNGNGILGSYPQARAHSTQSAEEQQLSSAARAIVNSIRNMQAKNTYQDKRGGVGGDRRNDRGRGLSYRPPAIFRQMSPGTWCRRSPAPVHPVMSHPRRPHPDSRNFRR